MFFKWMTWTWNKERFLEGFTKTPTRKIQQFLLILDFSSLHNSHVSRFCRFIMWTSNYISLEFQIKILFQFHLFAENDWNISEEYK